MVGVPWSDASTPRINDRPTSTARMAVAAENTSQNHSVLPNSKSWYPPSAAKLIIACKTSSRGVGAARG